MRIPNFINNCFRSNCFRSRNTNESVSNRTTPTQIDPDVRLTPNSPIFSPRRSHTLINSIPSIDLEKSNHKTVPETPYNSPKKKLNNTILNFTINLNENHEEININKRIIESFNLDAGEMVNSKEFEEVREFYISIREIRNVNIPDIEENKIDVQ